MDDSKTLNSDLKIMYFLKEIARGINNMNDDIQELKKHLIPCTFDTSSTVMNDNSIKLVTTDKEEDGKSVSYEELCVIVSNEISRLESRLAPIICLTQDSDLEAPDLEAPDLAIKDAWEAWGADRCITSSPNVPVPMPPPMYDASPPELKAHDDLLEAMDICVIKMDT